MLHVILSGIVVGLLAGVGIPYLIATGIVVGRRVGRVVTQHSSVGLRLH
jgi:hypothetical protein